MSARYRTRAERSARRRVYADPLIGAGMALCLAAFNLLFAARASELAPTPQMGLAMVACYPVLLGVEFYLVRRHLKAHPVYRKALSLGVAASLLVLLPFVFAVAKVVFR